jgi:hypothetical protein
MPVPDGWQVEDAAPTTPGMPCRGRPADRTVFLALAALREMGQGSDSPDGSNGQPPGKQ